VERIVLVRHAESVFSVRNILNGDPLRHGPLTERGRQEAAELRRELLHQDLDLCVTSPFLRARETADLALAGRHVPRLVLEEFGDVRVGVFEGKHVEEIRAWQRSRGPADPPPGGESRVDAIERYCRGFRLLLERPEPNVLLVTHGLPVTATLLAAKGEDPPISLEGVQVHTAEPYPLAAADLQRAVEHLEGWARRERTEPTEGTEPTGGTGTPAGA
jgi:2,3-bisphosphoglycerate-dependent phosphoglycerate mutase